eukprot:3196238-Prymnesium_polylepis.1
MLRRERSASSMPSVRRSRFCRRRRRDSRSGTSSTLASTPAPVSARPDQHTHSACWAAHDF